MPVRLRELLPMKEHHNHIPPSYLHPERATISFIIYTNAQATEKSFTLLSISSALLIFLIPAIAIEWYPHFKFKVKAIEKL
jgi:hypothetical protein